MLALVFPGIIIPAVEPKAQGQRGMGHVSGHLGTSGRWTVTPRHVWVPLQQRPPQGQPHTDVPARGLCSAPPELCPCSMGAIPRPCPHSPRADCWVLCLWRAALTSDMGRGRQGAAPRLLAPGPLSSRPLLPLGIPDDSWLVPTCPSGPRLPPAGSCAGSLVSESWAPGG